MHGITDPARIADLLATWGYLGIFVAVFVGNLGIPVPEETVMLAAGFFAGQTLLDLRLVYVVVIISAVIGDCCGYVIGRTGGQRVLIWLASTFPFMRTRYERLQLFFRPMAARQCSWRDSSRACDSWRVRWRARVGCRFFSSSDGTCSAQLCGARWS